MQNALRLARREEREVKGEKMRDYIELTETWACTLTFCSNAETVCDGRDVEPWAAEVASEVCAAGKAVAFDLLGDTGQRDSFYANWHGGKHARAAYRSHSLVAANLFHRHPEAQGDDDLIYSEWEWMDAKDHPRVLREGMDKIVEAICGAMIEALDAATEQIAKQSEEFSKEEAE